MSLWRVEVFYDKAGEMPSRVGYVNANSESDAADIVAEVMGQSERADMGIVDIVAKGVPSLPTRMVFWE